MHCAFLQLSVSEELEPQLYINSDGTVVKKLQLNSHDQHCLKRNQSLLSIWKLEICVKTKAIFLEKSCPGSPVYMKDDSFRFGPTNNDGPLNYKHDAA